MQMNINLKCLNKLVVTFFVMFNVSAFSQAQESECKSIPMFYSENPPRIPSSIEIGGPYYAENSDISIFSTESLELNSDIDISDFSDDVKDLARMLKYDYLLIYEYVSNNISNDRPFGVMRSPKITLIEKTGTSADQASLLVSLMRMCQYAYENNVVDFAIEPVSNINYVYGTIKFDFEKAANLFDVHADKYSLEAYLIKNKIPYTMGNDEVNIDHFWVEADINNETLTFDTFIKEYEYTSPNTDFAEIMKLDAIGYSQENFKNELNADVECLKNDLFYMQNVNVYGSSGVRDKLKDYSSKLVNYIEKNLEDPSLVNLIGGRNILLNYNIEPTIEHRYLIKKEYIQTSLNSNEYIKLNIKINNIDKTLNASDVYGESLILDFTNNYPQILVNNELIKKDSATVYPGLSQELILSISYPNGYGSRESVCSVHSGGLYYIMNSYGYVSKSLVSHHQSKIQNMIADGFVSSDVEVLFENATVFGYSYMSQLSYYGELLGQMNDLNPAFRLLGVCGQYRSPYIDIPGYSGNYIAKTKQADYKPHNTKEEFVSSLITTLFASSLEWGIWDQLDSYSACCTVNLLDRANSLGCKIYDINKYNFDDFYSSIKLSDFNESDLEDISESLEDLSSILVPEIGKIKNEGWTKGDWLGLGYLGQYSSVNTFAISCGITGGYSGGYSFNNSANFNTYTVYDAIMPSYSFVNESLFSSYYTPSSSSNYVTKVSFDPIDMLTGYYMFDAVDLSIGNGGGNISLSRHYDSGQASSAETGFGLGWSNSNVMRAYIGSNSFRTLGESSAIEAASVLTGSFIAYDLALSSCTLGDDRVVGLYSLDIPGGAEYLYEHDSNFTTLINGGLWNYDSTKISGYHIALNTPSNISSICIDNISNTDFSDAGVRDVVILTTNAKGEFRPGDVYDYTLSNSSLNEININSSNVSSVYIYFKNNYGNQDYIGIESISIIDEDNITINNSKGSIYYFPSYILRYDEDDVLKGAGPDSSEIPFNYNIDAGKYVFSDGLWDISTDSTDLGEIVVDLDHVVVVSQLEIYNMNLKNHYDCGARQVDVSYSEDGYIWDNLGEYTLSQSSEAYYWGDQLEEQWSKDTIRFEAIKAKSIKIKILNNYGNERFVGLTGIAIKSDYNPDYFQDSLLDTFIYKWLMDQMIDNTISLKINNAVNEYVKLANGTYSSPLGNSSKLLAEVNNDKFEYCQMLTPDGRNINFDSDGIVTDSVDTHGNTVTYTHDKLDRLTKIENDYGQYIKIYYYSNGNVRYIHDSANPPRYVYYYYDTDDNLIKVKDITGEETIYDYADTDPDGDGVADFENGLLEKIYYPGKVDTSGEPAPFVTTEYDHSGKVVRQTDAMGNVYDYFFSGTRSEEVSPAENETDDTEGGRYSSVTYYNEYGRIVKSVDKMGRETNYEYDGQLRQKSVTYPNGLSQELFYDTNHNVTMSVSLSKGFDIVSILSAGENGSVITLVEDVEHGFVEGESVWFNDFPDDMIDINSLEFIVLSVSGNEVTVDLDTTDIFKDPTNVSGVLRHALISTSEFKVKEFSNAYGDFWINYPVSATAPTGINVEYEYDFDTSSVDYYGNLEKVTTSYPDGSSPKQVTTYSYYTDRNFSFLERQSVKVNAIGSEYLTTKYYYDDDSSGDGTYNVLRTVVDPGGNNIISRSEYNDKGQVTTTYNPLGTRSEYQYDSSGRLIQTVAQNGVATENVYYPNGKIKEVLVKETADDNATVLNKSHYKYTLNDKQESVTDTLGNVSLFEYDSLERIYRTIDANGNVTENAYYPDGSLWKTINAKGETEIEYKYNEDGTVYSVTDANGNSTVYDYDYWGRPYRTIYPDDTYTQSYYDSLGRQVGLLTRAKDYFEYEYDNMERLEKEISTDRTISYTYDLLGNVKEVKDETNNETISNEYDILSRLMSVTYPGEKTVAYDYNNLGSKIALYYPDHTNDNPSYIQYAYDELGRLEKIFDSNGSEIVQYKYDILSRLKGIKYENGTYTNYSFVNAGSNNYTSGSSRLAQIYNHANNFQDTIQYTSYDNVGNRLNKIRNGNEHVYGYDKIYQLTNVTYPTGHFAESMTYSYDPAGNRDSDMGYEVNALNQYNSVDGTSYEYDDNGNLIYDGVNYMYYDVHNNLKAINSDISYGYNALGMRSYKEVDGKRTSYLYDGSQVLCEYDNNDVMVRKFVYGPGIDSPVRMTVYRSTDIDHNGSLGTDDLGAFVGSWLQRPGKRQL